MSLRVVLHTEQTDTSLEPVLLGQMLMDGFRLGTVSAVGRYGPRPTGPGLGDLRRRLRPVDRTAAVAASMFRACDALLRRRRVISVTLRVRGDCVELTAVCLPYHATGGELTRTLNARGDSAIAHEIAETDGG